MSAPRAHAHPQRRLGIVSALLLLSAVLGLIGYKNCTEKPRGVDAGSLQPDASQSTLEFGVTHTRLYRYAGTMDVENRYASTVMISTASQTTSVRCSGVLISPRVVLTAASCLCEPSQSPPPATREPLPENSVSCLDRAIVTTVVYGAVLDKEFPEDTARMSFNSYEGVVRPHPALSFVSDDAGPPRAGHADLAVIVLDEVVKDVAPETLMEQGEFQAHDPLIMAGYAHSGSKQTVGGLYGIRYFRKNTVTHVLTKEQGEVFYQQQGPFVYNGYAGGPCFREDSQRRLLAGVASIGTDEELSFTSVPPFLDWVHAQIGRAVSLDPPASDH